jgi:hypothetical protein
MNTNNSLDIITGVPEKSSCQEICQSYQFCNYFVYDDLSYKCFLLSDCATLVDCLSCWSGPDYPSVNSCLPPDNSTSTLPHSTEQTTARTTSPSQPMAALLLGGYYKLEPESWPCDLAIPSIPQEVIYGAAAVLGSKVFLCGGSISPSCNILEGNTWRNGSDMIMKRYGLSLTSLGDTLIAVGGFDIALQEDISSVEYYKDEEAHWQLAPWQLSPGRDAHCAVTLSNSELILSGGSHRLEDGNYEILSLVQKYNIETGEVFALPDLRRPTHCHACTLQGDSLVVSGGLNGGGEIQAAVSKLSLSTFTWSYLPPLPMPRFYHNMALLNEALVVFGDSYYGNNMYTLVILNGTKWHTQELQKQHELGVMVLLPCP